VFDLLEGIRVVELAQWVMVPSAAALLADLGADVIKIEHPATGDPYRALRTAALQDGGSGESPSVAHTNRGKRSLGLDVKHPAGRAVLAELLRGADVLLTSLRVPAMQRLGLDPDAVSEINPRLIYARANAFGYEGPDSDTGGYDATAYWARGGFAHSLTPEGAGYPVQMRPALGDRTTAMAIAMGICAALVKRERTGAGSVVDVSLMGTASWVLAGDLLAALTSGTDPVQDPVRSRSTNPLTNTYRTRDGRWISLVGMQPDRYWAGFCAAIGRPDLASDPRYASMAARAENAQACVAELDAAFAQADLSEWRDRLAASDLPWAPVQGAREIIEDPQTKANEWIVQLEDAGRPAYAIAGPVRVRGGDGRLNRAPAAGEHTEQILLELGRSWEQIAALKADRAVT
jgi:crotonobetainyl-CoA:carnitine CoA-transferase CaiB-like acyl-CoA transferase